MSTVHQTLNQFDTWILVEAQRIFGEETAGASCCGSGSSLEQLIEAVVDDVGASSDPPADFDAMLQRFRELIDARKALEEQANYCKSEAAKLEPLLVEAFGAEGTQSIKRNGKTFYLCREFQVSADGSRRAELVEAMRSLGHEDFIVCQPQRLAAYCREMLADESAGLPAEIKDLVKVHEQQRLRVRSS